MMNIFNKSIVTALLACSTSVSFAQSASEHASEGSRHSALASAHSTVASAQVASGVVAVPLLAVASTASVAQAAGKALIDAASATTIEHTNQPLEVTKITITVDRSPAQAMQQNN